MGMFERQPVNNVVPLYTIGGQETFLIIGLGNIGEKYKKTRHNLGFTCLDHFAEKMSFPGWIEKKTLNCLEAITTIDGSRVILAKPTTMMNESGIALQKLQNFYKIENHHTLIVHDDLDVILGKIRIRQGGSDAGNNGIKSIIQYGGENTWRLRLGIGPKTPEQIDSIKYVLGQFSKEDQQKIGEVQRGVYIIISEFIHQKGVLESETRNFVN